MVKSVVVNRLLDLFWVDNRLTITKPTDEKLTQLGDEEFSNSIYLLGKLTHTPKSEKKSILNQF